jgi:hypothetical protein
LAAREREETIRAFLDRQCGESFWREEEQE